MATGSWINRQARGRDRACGTGSSRPDSSLIDIASASARSRRRRDRRSGEQPADLPPGEVEIALVVEDDVVQISAGKNRIHGERDPGGLDGGGELPRSWASRADPSKFDVVLSTFGVMFAPRHAVAARELARVLRRGGRMGLATWAADGTVADLFRMVAAELPPRPEIAEPPLSWGEPAHVEATFSGTGIELQFERDALPVDPDVVVEGAADFYIESFGPLVIARQTLTEQGRWEALAARLPAAIECLVREPAEFLVITGLKR